MNAMGLVWLGMIGSLCAVLLLAIVLWVQLLQLRHQRSELGVLRDLLQSLGDVIRRLEQEKAELSAGLRAERGQVELLKRRLSQQS